jgi:aconitate hydratase
MDIDLATQPLGRDKDGEQVFLHDLWPSQTDVATASRTAVRSEAFRERYGYVFEGTDEWRALDVPQGERFGWDPQSTYIKKPPYFDGMPVEPVEPGDISGARVLALLGDSVTTDHISPAGSIAKTSPAAKYLIQHEVAPEDFNSYGSRRGNHEVMVRGTLANVRLRNLLAP